MKYLLNIRNTLKKNIHKLRNLIALDSSYFKYSSYCIITSIALQHLVFLFKLSENQHLIVWLKTPVYTSLKSA